MKKLVSVEGHRWAIEDSFETAKNELGFDHNETRSWHGWHRHVSLIMLAFAMMAAIRHKANTVPLKKIRPRATNKRSRSAGRSRKSAASPSSSHSGVSGLLVSSHGRCGGAPAKPRRVSVTSNGESNCNARIGKPEPPSS